jgi:hypothetical protein
MGRYFDLEMRPDGVKLAVEVFQEQDQAEI